MTTPPNTHTESTPLFDAVATEHALDVEQVLTSRPPSTAEVCAAHPRTDDEEAADDA